MLEKAFFFLIGDHKDALNNALMMSPYKSKWGTCMFQSWVLGFNPDNPNNLAFSTWVALRNLLFEHHDQAIEIAETLGEVIGIDTANEMARNPRFCVNVKINEGWVTNVELVFEEGDLPTQKVLVDYDKLPIRCKACHNWKHKVKDCSEIQTRPFRGGGKPPRAYNTNQQVHNNIQQEKGKHIDVDQDGFQMIKSKKKVARTISKHVDDELRMYAYEQRIGTTVAGDNNQPRHNAANNEHSVGLPDLREKEDGKNGGNRVAG